MSNKEEENFIRLLMFSVDLSTDVIRAFTESKILCNYDNNFTRFLESHKHDLFHSWIPNTHCCQCSSVTMGTALTKKMAEIDEAIFNKMYNKSGSTNLGHFKKGVHGSVTQHCLCRITPRSDMRLEDVDISLLCSIIYNCVKLQKEDFERIKTIRFQRWEVYGLAVTRQCNDSDFGRIWASLKHSVVTLVREHFIPSYGRIVEQQIQLILIADVTKVDVSDLLSKLSIDKKIGQVLNTRLNGITNAMRDETMMRQTLNKRPQYMDTDEEKENTLKERFTEHIGQIRLDILYPVFGCTGQRTKSTVRTAFNFKLDTPPSWDNKRLVTIINKAAAMWNEKDVNFHIQIAEVGSLVIKTTANPDIMQNKETFKKAIGEFLKKLVEVCEIDTSIPATIPVEINVTRARFRDDHGSAATGSNGIGEASGGGSVQLNIDMDSHVHVCNECEQKDEIIAKLKREIAEKDAYIEDLKKMLEEKLRRKSQEEAMVESKEKDDKEESENQEGQE